MNLSKARLFLTHHPSFRLDLKSQPASRFFGPTSAVTWKELLNITTIFVAVSFQAQRIHLSLDEQAGALRQSVGKNIGVFNSSRSISYSMSYSYSESESLSDESPPRKTPESYSA